MATKARKPRFDDKTGQTSFDVTQVIGTVTVDPMGDGEPADLAAFRKIVEFDMPGTFVWPNAFGGETSVTVGVAPDIDGDKDKDKNGDVVY